jgi:AcrR family transcriptional regulator
VAEETEDKTETRRERRIERKRLEIMQAAARVFAAKGYAGASTKDIAAEADLGESTLYNYFDSKRDILAAIAGRQAQLVDEIIISVHPEDETSLVSILDRTLEAILFQPLFTRAVLSEAWVNPTILEGYLEARLKFISGRLEGLVAQGMAEGKLRPVDPNLTARLIIGMALTVILPALRDAEPPPPTPARRALAESIISLLLDGIRAEPA